MALAGTVTKGFMYYGTVTNRSQEPLIVTLPIDPGAVLSKGDLCVMGGTDGNDNVAIRATSSSVWPFFVFLGAAVHGGLKNTTEAANGDVTAGAATGGIAWGEFIMVRKFIDLFRVTFAGHGDATVASTSSGRVFGINLGMDTDGQGEGAILYIYGGVGKGQMAIIEDYDQTGGTVELQVTLHTTLDVAPTTTSTIIALFGATNNSKVGFGDLFQIADHNNVTCDWTGTGNFRLAQIGGPGDPAVQLIGKLQCVGWFE